MPLLMTSLISLASTSFRKKPHLFYVRLQRLRTLTYLTYSVILNHNFFRGSLLHDWRQCVIPSFCTVRCVSHTRSRYMTQRDQNVKQWAPENLGPGLVIFWIFVMFWLDTRTRHLQRLKLRNICVCSWACAVDTWQELAEKVQFVLWVNKLNLRSTSQCWWWPLLTSIFGFLRLWISTADKDWSDVVLHESAWSAWMHCSIREWVLMCSDMYS